MITSAAWITSRSQATSTRSSTVPSLSIRHGPRYVSSLVPAGTPADASVGKPSSGGGGLVGSGVVFGDPLGWPLPGAGGVPPRVSGGLDGAPGAALCGPVGEAWGGSPGGTLGAALEADCGGGPDTGTGRVPHPPSAAPT